MVNLTRCKSWLQSHSDMMMDFVRIYLGVALFFKGIFFMSNRDYLIQVMDQAGSWWFAPAAMAHYIVPAHLVGGLMLALGLLTRVAALVQLPILLGAVFYVHLPKLTAMNVDPEMRQNVELSALVLFLTLIVFLHGSGRLSLDHVISKGQHQETPPVPRPA